MTWLVVIISLLTTSTLIGFASIALGAIYTIVVIGIQPKLQRDMEKKNTEANRLPDVGL